MGEVEVPAEARWGAQTQRAVENFPISGQGIGRELIAALGRIKEAAAAVNGRLGVLDADMAAAIAGAAAEVAAGDWDDHFPVDVFQTGSGTSSNMNANEVIAGLAAERLGRPVHPNDHVNASQSSNDVFPSAIHLAAVAGDRPRRWCPPSRHLADVLRRQAAETGRRWSRPGRTHLMDATPVTLGQELGGYATAVEHGIERLEGCLPRLGELALGGTAVGTGINAPPGFARGRRRPAGRGHRPAAAGGPRPLRGPGGTGRPGRGVGDAAHGRRLAGQDRQRPAVDGERAGRRAGRDPPARPPAGQLDHARARSTRSSPRWWCRWRPR